LFTPGRFDFQLDDVRGGRPGPDYFNASGLRMEIIRAFAIANRKYFPLIPNFFASPGQRIAKMGVGA
jgi:hypothetical protein